VRRFGQKGESFSFGQTKHVHDQRIEVRPALRSKDIGDGSLVRRITAQPIDGLGRKRHKPPGTHQRGGACNRLRRSRRDREGKHGTFRFAGFDGIWVHLTLVGNARAAADLQPFNRLTTSLVPAPATRNSIRSLVGREMTALVITIAQRKGGAGKTTLAAQLVVAWAKHGARVAALDADPQGSLTTWVNLRRARLGGEAIGFEFATLPGWRSTQWVEDRARVADLVVIDNPPHAETEAQIAVRAAKLVLIPVQPSPLDLWATEATLKMARDERRPSIVALNRVSPRSGLTDEIASDLTDAGVMLASTRIGNRIALARAMASGLGVVESAPRSRAAAEINALAVELRKR
jgi:chromosome partitioning protein